MWIFSAFKGLGLLRVVRLGQRVRAWGFGGV